MPTKRRSRRQWHSLITELERSGLSPAEFAAARDLNVSTLRWWRTRLKSAPLTLVPVPAPAPVVTESLHVTLDDRVSVRVPAASATTEVAAFLASIARGLRP